MASSRMKALVLGANGRLGKEIIYFLEAMGVDVHALTRRDLDVANKAQMSSMYHLFDHTDVVINCTAFNGLEACVTFPDSATAVNTMAPYFLARHCNERNILFVHFSTDYATSSESPIRETCTGQPISFYGASKRAGEILVLNAWHRSLVFRISSLYGSDMAGALAPLKLYNDVDESAPIKVFPQFTAPISTRMVAARTITAIEQCLRDPDTNKYGLYNIGNTSPVWKHDFALYAIQLHYTDLAKPNIIEASELPIKRPEVSVLDPAKFHSTFGVPYSTVYDDLKESLAAWGVIDAQPSHPSPNHGALTA